MTSLPIKAKYYDGEVAKSHAVFLEISGEQLNIISTDSGTTLLSWPLDHIKVLEEAAPPSPAKLSISSAPESRIFIEDKYDWQHLKPKLPKEAFNRFSLPISWASIIGYIGISIALLIFLFVFIPRFLEYGAYIIPLKWEKQLGDHVVEGVINRPVCVAPEGQKAMDRLIQKLQDGAHAAGYNRNLQYKIYVVYAPKTMNALAAPGGNLILFSGVITKATNPDEVAGIMAHEMGHIELYHPTRGVIRDIGLSVLLSMMFGSDTGFIQLAGTMGQLSYSRQNESEADAIGGDILKKADIKPKSLILFFDKLPDFDVGLNDGLQNILSYLSTHPMTDERIGDLEKRFEDDQTAYQPAMSKSDWAALKQICSKKENFKPEE